jgi:ketosteroid isomerase-like protein
MEATNDRDFDAAMSVFAPDATFDVTSAGLGVFRGLEAIRAYLEDWVGAYQRQRFSEWDGEDLGGGVVLAVAALDARLPGSTASVRERWAFTCRFHDGRITSVKADGDLERARAEARRLAAGAGAGAG